MRRQPLFLPQPPQQPQSRDVGAEASKPYWLQTRLDRSCCFSMGGKRAGMSTLTKMPAAPLGTELHESWCVFLSDSQREPRKHDRADTNQRKSRPHIQGRCQYKSENKAAWRFGTGLIGQRQSPEKLHWHDPPSLSHAPPFARSPKFKSTRHFIFELKIQHYLPVPSKNTTTDVPRRDVSWQ